jgi:Hint domain
MTDISSLNNTTFNELDSSLLLQINDGLVLNGGTYVASPNGIGLATYDNWVGTLNSGPSPGDIVKYSLTVADENLGVVQYTFTTADGTVNPPSGGQGAEVVGWNSTGVLLEQLTGYIPGQTALTPDGQFLIVENSSVDLATFDANGNPMPEQATTAELTFSTTGPFPTSFGAVCFAAGTRITCETGEVAVEDLHKGDRVVLADGGSLPVVWIGVRRINCRRHPNPEAVLPIRIDAGAFGDALPRRPLVLSPEHAVFTGGVLIPIRRLVNGTNVRRASCETVIYYHVELERHAVLLAEGLPAESFLEVAGNRSWFDNGPRLARRGPQPPDAILIWEALACAPFVVTGNELDAARRLLAERAALADEPRPEIPTEMFPVPATGTRACHTELAKA